MILLYENAQTDEKLVEKKSNQLSKHSQYLTKIFDDGNYSADESFINLPADNQILHNVAETKHRKVRDDLKYIIVVGIGGSDLGTKAVYDALYGHFDNVEPTRFPKVIFIETNDSKQIEKVQDLISNQINSPEEIIINAVSKSGRTIETIANLEILMSNIPFAKDRLVVTTSRDSELWKHAKEMEIDTLEIPQKVGGRFSVFSAVGLFPLVCANVDIKELQRGAKDSVVQNIQADTKNNHSMLSAITIYNALKNKKTILDTMFFNPELETLGEWYEQLISESLGKKGTGITPTTSIGSTDLHSKGQLDIDGPEDKFFTFVSTKSKDGKPTVPEETKFDLIEEIEGKPAEEIKNAILEAAKKTFSNHKIPLMEVVLDTISPYEIGKFMQFKMIETVYLAELLNVNAFDQPAVEEYKKETKKILSKDHRKKL